MLKAAGIQLGHLELPQQQPAASTANPTALADADNTGTNSAPAGTAEPAAAADSSAVAAASGDGGAGAELAAGPQWEWSDAESMLFPLCKFELVEQLLRSCKPPLLGRGGAIPPATLAAFRWGACAGLWGLDSGARHVHGTPCRRMRLLGVDCCCLCDIAWPATDALHCSAVVWRTSCACGSAHVLLSPCP